MIFTYEGVMRAIISLVCYAILAMGIAMAFDLTVMQWIGMSLIFLALYCMPSKVKSCSDVHKN